MSKRKEAVFDDHEITDALRPTIEAELMKKLIVERIKEVQLGVGGVPIPRRILENLQSALNSVLREWEMEAELDN